MGGSCPAVSRPRWRVSSSRRRSPWACTRFWESAPGSSPSKHLMTTVFQDKGHGTSILRSNQRSHSTVGIANQIVKQIYKYRYANKCHNIYLVIVVLSRNKYI